MCDTPHKICKTCKVDKPIIEFRFREDENRYITSCKNCEKISRKLNYILKKKSIRLSRKNYYKSNKDKILQQNKLWRSNNKEIIKNSNKMYRIKNYHILKRKRELNKSNRNAKLRNRYKNDIKYRIICSLRHRLWETIVKEYKITSIKNLIGCSIDELKIYLSSQFKQGMSWDNYGKWHIDHIRPCASFDLTDPEQQKQCFHYTNLQPLWAVDNLRKNSFYNL